MIGYRPDAGAHALYLGKDSGGGAATPDFTALAEKQAGASQSLATQKTWADRPTQNTPWGSQFWTQEATIDPATGEPVTAWTQNQTLDPALQSALNDQLGIQAGRSQLANQFLGRVANEYSQPFNWQGAPGMAATPQSLFTYGRDTDTGLKQITQAQSAPEFVDERHRIEQGLFDRMQPTHDYQQQQLQTQLANQGLTIGSEAYNQELARLSDQQARERWNALEMGGQEQARLQGMQLGRESQAFQQRGSQADLYNRAQQQMYGQDLGANAQNFQQNIQGGNFQNQARQQWLAEEAQRRGMSLNELNALLTGQQVGQPNMPSFNSATMGQAPDYMGAGQAQYGASQDAASAAQAGQQSSMSGLFALAGTAATVY